MDTALNERCQTFLKTREAIIIGELLETSDRRWGTNFDLLPDGRSNEIWRRRHAVVVDRVRFIVRQRC